MPTFWRVRLMLLIAVVLALAVAGGYWGVAAAMRSSGAAPFRPHLAEYLAAPEGPAHPGPVRGKMIVVDKKTRDIDDEVFFGLPSSLRASRPEEVGTVVQLDYGRVPGRGVYGKDHLPSFVQTCQVTVIDRASRAVLATALVRGGDPPDHIQDGDKEGVGPRPTAQVLDYLKGLPRQES